MAAGRPQLARDRLARQDSKLVGMGGRRGVYSGEGGGEGTPHVLCSRKVFQSSKGLSMRFHYQNTHNFEFKEEMIWNKKEGSAHEIEAKISSNNSNHKLKNIETLLKLD